MNTYRASLCVCVLLSLSLCLYLTASAILSQFFQICTYAQSLGFIFSSIWLCFRNILAIKQGRSRTIRPWFGLFHIRFSLNRIIFLHPTLHLIPYSPPGFFFSLTFSCTILFHSIDLQSPLLSFLLFIQFFLVSLFLSIYHCF